MAQAGKRWPMRLGALPLVLLLAAHVELKLRTGYLPEVLWSCHVNSALMALALLVPLPALSRAAFVFSVAVGLPAWAFELAASRTTTWTSVGLHLLTPALGWASARRTGLAPAACLHAWLFYVALLPVSRLLTPPELNVNLAHGLWAPLFGPSRAMLLSWLLNGALAGTLLWAAALVLRRLGPRAGLPVPPAGRTSAGTEAP